MAGKDPYPIRRLTDAASPPGEASDMGAFQPARKIQIPLPSERRPRMGAFQPARKIQILSQGRGQARCFGTGEGSFAEGRAQGYLKGLDRKASGFAGGKLMRQFQPGVKHGSAKISPQNRKALGGADDGEHAYSHRCVN